MILSALNEHYQRLAEQEQVPTFGFSAENISYALILSAEGELVDIHDLRDTNGKKTLPRVLSVPQPEKRTSGVKSNFMWDKTAYVLGIKAGKDKGQRLLAEKEQEAFKALHQSLLTDVDNPSLQALLVFLEAWHPDQFQPPLFRNEMLDANFVFRVEGEQQYLHDLPEAQSIRRNLLSDSEAVEGFCLVSGETAPVERIHPSVKGVNGAQSSGASIVSFNGQAFTSFNKSQGDNAQVSKQAAFAYTTALNHLLRRGEHNRQRLQIGDATAVFWAVADDCQKAEAAESLFAALFEPSSSDEQETARLRSVLENIAQGRALSLIDPALDEDTRFCVLGLAPNASRLSIRFWLQDSLGHLVCNLSQHYADLEIQPPPWKSPPALWRLLYATAVLGKAENIPPQLAGEMTRAILSGGRYPRSILANALMRIRSEAPAKDENGARDKQQRFNTNVALIKAVLVRDLRLGVKGINEEVPVSLDKESTHAGYRLGRLFAVLENAQSAALNGQINATIRDRYYGAASATPALVFPTLLKNYANHLAKLRKGNDKDKRIAGALERDIGEIIDGIGSTFPKCLRIEDQGRFAIGYYQQSQVRFNKVNSNAAETTSDSEQGATE